MTGKRTSEAARWLWPVACLITLAGYFGSWVAHPVAGLAILGLDLGEYVKFLPTVAAGQVTVWREGFYAPLVAVAAACGLLAYRKTYAYPFLLRLALILVGLVAALNLLPPAWSPAVLRSAEFRLQTIAIALSVAMLFASPLLALLPALPVYAIIAGLGIAGIWFPAWGFLSVLPAIAGLYGHALQPSWAFYVAIVGLLLLLASCWAGFRRETSVV